MCQQSAREEARDEGPAEWQQDQTSDDWTLDGDGFHTVRAIDFHYSDTVTNTMFRRLNAERWR